MSVIDSATWDDVWMSQDQKDFAGLVASVLPLVLLALLVEARSPDQRREIAALGANAKNDLYRSCSVLVFLAFLEVAALLTAGGYVGPCVLGWLSGPPSAIGVGILLLLLGQMVLLRLARAAKTFSDLELDKLKVQSGVLLTVGIFAGLVSIAVLWPPSSPGCEARLPVWWILGGIALLLWGWRAVGHVQKWWSTRPRR